MIDEIKEDMNEFQQNPNKKLIKIKKTMQDMKNEFSKEIQKKI
jgi:hypothetical protein